MVRRNEVAVKEFILVLAMCLAAIMILCATGVVRGKYVTTWANDESWTISIVPDWSLMDESNWIK